MKTALFNDHVACDIKESAKSVMLSATVIEMCAIADHTIPVHNNGLALGNIERTIKYKIPFCIVNDNDIRAIFTLNQFQIIRQSADFFRSPDRLFITDTAIMILEDGMVSMIAFIPVYTVDGGTGSVISQATGDNTIPARSVP